MSMTAIYYSANVELEPFAGNVIGALMAAKGDVPVISVTQKPVAAGRNIVVGAVGVSGFNAVRQLQIGAQAATTKYVCTVEADSLYPPEYFSFLPPDDKKLYLAAPTWLAFVRRRERKYFSLKGIGFEGALVADRELLLRSLEDWLDGMPEWVVNDAEHLKLVVGTQWPRRKHRRKPYYWYYPRERFQLPTPVLSFKTSQNLHSSSRHSRNMNRSYLEPFGDIMETFGRWCCGPR